MPWSSQLSHAPIELIQILIGYKVGDIIEHQHIRDAMLRKITLHIPIVIPKINHVNIVILIQNQRHEGIGEGILYHQKVPPRLLLRAALDMHLTIITSEEKGILILLRQLGNIVNDTRFFLIHRNLACVHRVHAFSGRRVDPDTVISGVHIQDLGIQASTEILCHNVLL